jgi:hypothetical protein
MQPPETRDDVNAAARCTAMTSPFKIIVRGESGILIMRTWMCVFPNLDFQTLITPEIWVMLTYNAMTWYVRGAVRKINRFDQTPLKFE